MKLFEIDSPLMQILTKITDLIILNVLWLLCCLPIITIVPSTTALYYMTLHMVEGREGSYVIESFFKAFGRNFKKSLFIWLIILPSFLIVFTNLLLSFNGSFGDRRFLTITFFVPVILLVILSTYIFAYTSRYEDTVLICMKNSLIIGVSNILSTLVMVILNTMPIILAFISLAVFTKFFIVWVLIGFSLTAYINSFIVKRIFASVEARTMAERK